MLPRTADAVVIGGGLVGCATARALAARGVRTVLLERATVGGEASSAAAGMVAPQAECDRPGPLLEAGVASRRRYAHFVAAIREVSGMSVDYRRDGIVYVAVGRTDARRLERRVRWQLAAGLRVRRLSAAAARRRIRVLSPHVVGGAFFPDDHRVDNVELTHAVARAARRTGVRVVERTAATSVVAARGHVSAVRTTEGSVAAPIVVDAAGAWAAAIRLPPGVAPPPVVPVRGQMMVLRAEPGVLPAPLYSAAVYLVPRADGRILVGSTREHAGFDKRVTLAATARLLAAAHALAPGLADASFEGAYAGLRPGTRDGLPIVGQAAELSGLFYAAGLYRHGILLAPLVAEAVADLVADGRTRLPVTAFRPDRPGHGGAARVAAAKI